MRELEPCPQGQVITESPFCSLVGNCGFWCWSLNVHGSFLLWWTLVAKMSAYPVCDMSSKQTKQVISQWHYNVQFRTTCSHICIEISIVSGCRQLMPLVSPIISSTRLYSDIPAPNHDEKCHFRVANDLSSSIKLQAPSSAQPH